MKMYLCNFLMQTVFLVCPNSDSGQCKPFQSNLINLTGSKPAPTCNKKIHHFPSALIVGSISSKLLSSALNPHVGLEMQIFFFLSILHRVTINDSLKEISDLCFTVSRALSKVLMGDTCTQMFPAKVQLLNWFVAVRSQICVLVQIRLTHENVERFLHLVPFSQRRNQMFSWCLTILGDGFKLTHTYNLNNE